MSLRRLFAMSGKIPRLLLFDIDGTLITSRNSKAGGGVSLLNALSIAFEHPIERKGVQFAGGTDPSISDDLLLANGISRDQCKNYDENVLKALELLPGIMEKGVADGNFKWTILPNVKQLLEKLAERPDVKLGLLTGNLQTTAKLKLKSAGISLDLFHTVNSNILGAFGSDNGVRSKLVEVAKQRYCVFLGVANVEANDMVVIGDTPKDILCAHDNGVPCVAVATGIHTKEDLAQADYVLSGFHDVDESVRAIVETCKV